MRANRKLGCIEYSAAPRRMLPVTYSWRTPT